MIGVSFRLAKILSMLFKTRFVCKCFFCCSFHPLSLLTKRKPSKKKIQDNTSNSSSASYQFATLFHSVDAFGWCSSCRRRIRICSSCWLVCTRQTKCFCEDFFIYLFICLFVYIYLFVYLFICLFVYLFVYLFFILFVYYLFIYLFVCVCFRIGFSVCRLVEEECRFARLGGSDRWSWASASWRLARRIVFCRSWQWWVGSNCDFPLPQFPASLFDVYDSWWRQTFHWRIVGRRSRCVERTVVHRRAGVVCQVTWFLFWDSAFGMFGCCLLAKAPRKRAHTHTLIFVCFSSLSQWYRTTANVRPQVALNVSRVCGCLWHQLCRQASALSYQWCSFGHGHLDSRSSLKRRWGASFVSFVCQKISSCVYFPTLFIVNRARLICVDTLTIDTFWMLASF